MSKSFIERVRDDIRRARGGENILTEEPDFVLVPDDHSAAQATPHDGRANVISVSKFAFSRLTKLAKKHKMDVSEYMEQLVSQAK